MDNFKKAKEIIETIFRDCDVSKDLIEEAAIYYLKFELDKKREKMKIEIEIPDKVKLKDIKIASCEYSLKLGRHMKKWKSWLKRYKPLNFPPTCEYCQYVGEAMWHCHNPESSQNNINVSTWNTCSEWKPNVGLMMFLYGAKMHETITGYNYACTLEKPR